MPTSETYNVDCMEFMRSLPDNAFELAVCDPPFGGARSQTVQVERENKARRITASEIEEVSSSDISVTRTGGTWATKYGKKS